MVGYLRHVGGVGGEEEGGARRGTEVEEHNYISINYISIYYHTSHTTHHTQSGFLSPLLSSSLTYMSRKIVSSPYLSCSGVFRAYLGRLYREVYMRRLERCVRCIYVVNLYMHNAMSIGAHTAMELYLKGVYRV